MQTEHPADERMLERERQLLAVVVLGPILLAQVLLLYAGLGDRGLAGFVPGLIGLYACGAVVLVDRHRTLGFQLALSGGLAVLTGTSALLFTETTYVVGAVGFATATLYYGWRWWDRRNRTNTA